VYANTCADKPRHCPQEYRRNGQITCERVRELPHGHQFGFMVVHEPRDEGVEAGRDQRGDDHVRSDEQPRGHNQLRFLLQKERTGHTLISSCL